MVALSFVVYSASVHYLKLDFYANERILRDIHVWYVQSAKVFFLIYATNDCLQAI